MDEWRFSVRREAEADLNRLDGTVRRRVVEKLTWFVEHFDSITPFPLGEPWRGFFKLRVGDWRVIYEIEDAKRLITVHAIGRRDEVYKLRR